MTAMEGAVSNSRRHGTVRGLRRIANKANRVKLGKDAATVFQRLAQETLRRPQASSRRAK